MIAPAPICFEPDASTGNSDHFRRFLDDEAPEIVHEEPASEAPGVEVRKVMFRLRDDSEVFAVICRPKDNRKCPGILILHGGGGCAELEKAIAWAQRGYIAVAPDLPGIAEPEKLTRPKGRWQQMKYGEGRYVASPDASASILFDAVLAAMKSLYLLRSLDGVDPGRIGVVGISWGGYMTTMVCGLAGDLVRAGFSVFGCGFYELTSQWPTLLNLPEGERSRWIKHLDAGRRAPAIKAAYFIAGATNDFFYWPPAVQATLDAIPGAKNHLFSPNSNHEVALPGGTVFPDKPSVSFTPTAFQPFPTPEGNSANWMAMEVPFFDYFLRDIGEPLPVVTVERGADPLLARFRIASSGPNSNVVVYWAASGDEDWVNRKWSPVPAACTGPDCYEARLPAEAAAGALWFAVASDSRPVTVSGDLISTSAQAGIATRDADPQSPARMGVPSKKQQSVNPT